MKVGDLVCHKSLGLGIVTKKITFDELKQSVEPSAKSLFPIFEFKTFELHYYNPYDDVIVTKRDYILDQEQIAEFVEILNESR